jgi:hypothetical protein
LNKGVVTTILKELDETGYGEHVIVIHPDLPALRKIYCQYTKNQLVDNNEIVLLLPHYETPDAVKNNLQESKSDDSSPSSTATSNVGCIDVQKHEKEGSLIVIDSIKAHFHSDSDIKSFIKQLVQHAENTGKRGVSILVDMGSFYHYGKIDELIEHELSIPSNYYNIKLKRFCIYHEKDFNRLKEEYKHTLSQHHGKELVVIKEE